MLAELPRRRWAPWVHREGAYLLNALTDRGNYNKQYTGGAAAGSGDNAHGQYGVLGLVGLQRAGWSRISKQHWSRVDAYWRAAQQKVEGDGPAGWAIYTLDPGGSGAPKGLPSYTNVRGPMTAGAVAVLSATERALYGPKMDLGKAGVSVHLRRGLSWMDRNFTLSDAAEELDRYFYFFTIQSVGRYTGYRTFNGIDWFREVTARMLAEQQSDGSWSGNKGSLLSTSFALLYLARANDPLAISKVRWRQPRGEGAGDAETPVEASWNNRPHDIWNFVDYASDRYEVSTTWQIAELSQPLYELMESRMMYLATDERLRLSDDQVAKLRAYVDAGGLLVTNPDGSGTPAIASIQRLAKRMFEDRGYRLEKIGTDDPIRHIHAVKVNLPMQMVHNGIRPLMVHFTRDVGRELQRFNTAHPAFNALSNLYLFTVGKRPQQSRLLNDFVVRREHAPSRSLSAARIRHDGNFDPEPRALEQLQAILANDHDIDLSLSTLSASELDRQRIAFLTTIGRFELKDAEVAALRRWIEGGGTLWIDVAGGGQEAIESQRMLVAKLAPDAQPKLMGRRDPIISGRDLDGGLDCRRVQYRRYALRVMGRRITPQLEMIQIDGRPAIIYSTVDLTAGVAGLNHWGIFGYSVTSARNLVTNGCLAVMDDSETAPASASR